MCCWVCPVCYKYLAATPLVRCVALKPFFNIYNFDFVPLLTNFTRDNERRKMKEITTFEEHLDQRYGKIGTEKRTNFEIKAKAFAIGEILREARKESKMTQEDLAKKTGTRKSFISRIENGHSDIQLSTLYRLVEIGFGKRVYLTIA